MNRTPMVRKTPMKRTSMARKTAAPKMTAKKKPKKRVGHDPVALAACKGEPCYLRIPDVCLGAAGQDTVVPAHSNQAIHGKGERIKAYDCYTVPACMACHAEIDSGKLFPREEKFSFWDYAYTIWAPVRAAKLSPLGKAVAAIPTSKIVPRSIT